MLEYNNNYSITSGSLWNYYRDEIDHDASSSRINKNKTTANKSFEYKTKLIAITPNNGSRLAANVVVVVLLVIISKF